MNMHVPMPTPTEASALDRRRAFYADIAEKADRLAESKRRRTAPPLIVGLPSFYLTRTPRKRGGCAFIDRIIDIVASRFGLTHADLMNERRTKDVVLPRHIAVYLCRRLTRKSYPVIASSFGYFDHSVIVYAISKIERLVQTDPEIARHVEALSLEIGALA